MRCWCRRSRRWCQGWGSWSTGPRSRVGPCRGSPGGPGCGGTPAPRSTGSAPSPPRRSWCCTRPSCSNWSTARPTAGPGPAPRRARGRSSRPCHGRGSRTSCSCWSRTPARPGTRRARRGRPRPPDRRSRPRRTRRAARGCSTAARCSSCPRISDLRMRDDHQKQCLLSSTTISYPYLDVAETAVAAFPGSRADQIQGLNFLVPRTMQ